MKIRLNSKINIDKKVDKNTLFFFLFNDYNIFKEVV